MSSTSEEESPAPAIKLNPQALDFIPVAEPAKEEAADLTPTSDNLGASEEHDQPDTQSDITAAAAGRKRNRGKRSRKKRNFEQFDLSKGTSEDKPSEDKPLPDKSFFGNKGANSVDNKSVPRSLAVAKQSTVPGYIGAGHKDKEDNSPVYGHALTWKSDNVKAKDEYARIRRNVRAVAPEQFLDKARPSNQKANVFPRTVGEWQVFKSESLQDRLKELSEDTTKMGDQVEATQNMDKDGVPRDKRVPKSVYGGPNGKVFEDDFAPVTGQPTIWSEAHLSSDQPKADWPTRAELLEDGDQRENSQVQTRSGRHLPTPRYPQNPGEPYVSFKDRAAISQNPLDQTGPIYRNGLGEITEPYPADIDEANEEMNNDPTFEAQALHFLGSDLMDEIGRWKAPVVPEWQSRQRRERQAQLEAAEGLTMVYQGLYGMQLGGQSQGQGQSSGADREDRTSISQHQGPSTPNGLPYSDAIGSYDTQLFDMANVSLTASAGQNQDQSPAGSADDSGFISSAGMVGWMFMGRSELAGTNTGEDIWMAPWGQVFRNRDNYWY